MTRTAAETRGGVSVLVAGGGVAALETALALRALAHGLVDVELLAPELHFFYRPLAVAEPFGAGRVHRWELDDLVRAAGADFVPGQLAGVDADAHIAQLKSGLEIDYDTLVLATGHEHRQPSRERSPSAVRPTSRPLSDCSPRSCSERSSGLCSRFRPEWSGPCLSTSWRS